MTSISTPRARAAGNASKDRQLAILYEPIAELLLNPSNPRVHTEKQIRQIARSLEAFGPIVPILIDGKRQVIAGHGRLLAARHLGLTEFPTISVGHLTEAQAKAFAIADNKLTENSTWDQALLAEQLKALSEVELDFSLEATGFEMGEIDVLVDGLAPVHDPDRDPADAIPEETTTRVSAVGDVWCLGKHRVVCGDAREAAEYAGLMNDRRASVVFADPPYNVPIDGHASGSGKKRHRDFAMACGEMNEQEFTDFLSRVCNLLARYSRDGSLHFVCMDWRHLQEVLTAGREAYSDLKNLCIWSKHNAGMGSLYRSQHELIFVFKNGKDSHRNNVQLGQYGRYRTNVWNYPGANSFSRSTQEGNLLELHPTVKPVALISDAIMDCSARGDIVLDPFLGSGTTVIAAERTGRVCYGIELDPAYVDTIVRRWQSFTGLSAIHATSGRNFTELEKEAARG